jgi:hypothetical protein
MGMRGALANGIRGATNLSAKGRTDKVRLRGLVEKINLLMCGGTIWLYSREFIRQETIDFLD